MKLFKSKQFIAISVAFFSVVFYSQFIATAAPGANILRNVLPETDVTYDLGTSTKRWNSISTNNITISGTCTGCGGSSSGGGLATSTTGQYTAGNLFFVANSSTASASDNLRYTTSTGAFAVTATSMFTGQFTQTGGLVGLASTTITGTAAVTGVANLNGLTNNGNATTTNLSITAISGSTQCLRVNTNGLVSGTGVDCATSTSTGANPTATIGLTATNGTANTFLRSDGAPALSQSIKPTWTGLHTWNAGNGNLVTGSGAAGVASLFQETGGGQGGGVNFGNNTAAIGVSSDGVSNNYDYDGAFIFRQLGTNPDSDAEFIFLEESGDWRFVLPKSGAGLATYNPRSMIIAGPSTNVSSTLRCSTWGFNAIDCNTSATGADLGVQDDLQVLGSAFVSSTLNASGTITQNGVPVLKSLNGTSSNIAFFSDQSTLTSHDNFRIVTSTMTLRLISKGVSNLFIGNDAGILQTTGESNTFIGDVAGASNATGSFNTAIGNGALGNLGSVGSGDSNIGIGYTSGFGVTSGTLNIFLGNGSGLSGGVASNNILIGHNTDISSGVNNAIAIGNGITVNTSNTGAIGGTGFKLGIGTQQPSSTLHVVGSLQIPTNQTLSLGGQVSVKTTSSTFNYHNGTNEFALNPVQCSNSAFTIANVTSTSSQYDFWHPVATSTITRLTARNGNASGTMDFNIIWHANGSTASSSQSHLFNGSGQVGNVTSSATTTLDIFPSLVSFASTTVKANDVVQIITGPRASSTQWTFGICWKEIP